jgi:hypothetical protein
VGLGSTGSFVATVQQCLDLESDGDFGQETCDAVHLYQLSADLQSDGVVGDETWAKLERDFNLPPYPPPLLPPIRPEMAQLICEMAESSPVATFQWEDRGVAPIGYVKGMTLAWASALRNWVAEDSSAREMGKACVGNEDEDALAWYADVFRDLGMDNSRAGVDALRHLFVLLFGLGMRESSGRHCEGRDLSAENTSAETAEAGLFQMSWNASSCSDEMQKLYDQYKAETQDKYDATGGCEQCLLEVFEEDVACSEQEWESYGDGAGRDYQDMAKACPQFAAEMAAVGLRNLRQHWGPINRYEAQVLPEVDHLLFQVQSLLLELTEV